MFRTFFLASRLLLCSATAALAQQALPNDAVGGGEVRMVGSGDDASFVRTGPAPSQPGRAAVLQGGTGDGPEVTYIAPVPPGERGRLALLMGSRDEATVVYPGREIGAPGTRG